MLILALALAFAAAPHDAAPTAHVRVHDLDLSRAADRARLNRRVATAAASLCQAPDGLIPLERRAAASRCVRAALASAAPQLALLTGGPGLAQSDTASRGLALAAR